METIIVKPRNPEELTAVLGVLRKMKIKTEVYKEQTKEDVLSTIEHGAKAVTSYLKGKRKLKEVNK